MRLVLFVALLSAVPAHAGDFYKCKDGRGRTSYQDTPCASGSTEQLDIKPQQDKEQTRGVFHGGYSESELSAQRDIQAAKELDRDRRRAAQDADIDRRYREVDRRAAEREERYRMRQLGR